MNEKIGYQPFFKVLHTYFPTESLNKLNSILVKYHEQGSRLGQVKTQTIEDIKKLHLFEILSEKGVQEYGRKINYEDLLDPGFQSELFSYMLENKLIRD